MNFFDVSTVDFLYSEPAKLSCAQLALSKQGMRRQITTHFSKRHQRDHTADENAYRCGHWKTPFEPSRLRRSAPACCAMTTNVIRLTRRVSVERCSGEKERIEDGTHKPSFLPGVLKVPFECWRRYSGSANLCLVELAKKLAVAWRLSKNSPHPSREDRFRRTLHNPVGAKCLAAGRLETSRTSIEAYGLSRIVFT